MALLPTVYRKVFSAEGGDFITTSVCREGEAEQHREQKSLLSRGVAGGPDALCSITCPFPCVKTRGADCSLACSL